MRIGISRKQGYTQVNLVGVLASDAVPVIREELDHLLSGPVPAVIWHLESLEEASVEVFAEIARAIVLIRLRGGSSIVAGPSERFRKHLKRIGFADFVGSARDLKTAEQLMARAQKAIAALAQGATNSGVPEAAAPVAKAKVATSRPAAATTPGTVMSPDTIAPTVPGSIHQKLEAPKTPAPASLEDSSARPQRSEFVRVSLLGEILIDLGVLDEPGLRRALDEQRSSQEGEKLGSILLRLDIVTPPQILSALETQYSRRLHAGTGLPAEPPDRAEFVRRNMLGQILQEIGVVDDAGLQTALAEQRRGGGKEKLGDVLLRLGIVTPEQLLRALEAQANL